MGYKRDKKVYKLSFSDPEMAGLEVRTRGLGVGELMELSRLVDMPTVTREDKEAKTRRSVESLFSAIVSWNLEDENGNPVEPTLENLYREDEEFVATLLVAWMTAVAGVSPPLNQQSSAGKPSVEASIPMELLSENLAS